MPQCEEFRFNNYLTRIFYEKLLSLCQNQGAKWQKLEVVISHNCKAQLMPLFYPQLRNYLIIRGVYFLHRQVKLHTNDKR